MQWCGICTHTLQKLVIFTMKLICVAFASHNTAERGGVGGVGWGGGGVEVGVMGQTMAGICTHPPSPKYKDTDIAILVT